MLYPVEFLPYERCCKASCLPNFNRIKNVGYLLCKWTKRPRNFSYTIS